MDVLKSVEVWNLLKPTLSVFQSLGFWQQLESHYTSLHRCDHRGVSLWAKLLLLRLGPAPLHDPYWKYLQRLPLDGMRCFYYTYSLSRNSSQNVLKILGGSRALLPRLCAGVLLLRVWGQVPRLLHSRGGVCGGLQWPWRVRELANTWSVS